MARHKCLKGISCAEYAERRRETVLVVLKASSVRLSNVHTLAFLVGRRTGCIAKGKGE